MAEPIDWDLALATGVRTAPGGPDVSMTQAADEVAALRAAAREVVAPVARITGLHADGSAPAVVVDRAEWVRSNTEALRRLVSPLTEANSAGGGLLGPVTARVAAVQVGLAFGWLSSKVLGQYEVLPGSDEGEPRLLLVAPNIVTAADAMGVDAHDFRLWVCMHEETHRVQFGANPWLAEYFASEVAVLVADLDVSPAEALRRVASGLRRRESGGIATWVQSEQMRSRMSGLVALMSLLEGHADWVMDQSGDVVPSALALRAAFEQRRRSSSLVDSVIRQLLGLDAKMAQYRDGAAFVRAVVAEVGLDGFNRIWTSPATLPLASEIHHPAAWIARVRAF
jgi:coenzyme F420 biosynthesis associated uncharacterized protein